MSNQKAVNRTVTIDGNTAASYVAHATNEVIAIYPITPSSQMGELADEMSAKGIPNIWGTVPKVVEMQSEAGAAGAIHGALSTGSLTTTFTASQGLLLMIPNMYKIAGELTSTVFHIAARSVAAQALSIFGDHSDVMSTRSTGFGVFFSNSVQEVMDLALIAQASTLESRIPFLHAFDGFRTSHEVMKIEELSKEEIRAMIDDKFVHEHRARGLSPDRPVIHGTSQNPDVFFQARETVNKYYIAVPDIVEKIMDKFADVVGRRYNLFDYVGAADAERVIVIMGSGSETVEETVHHLINTGEKVGVLKVRLFRPFSTKHFLDAIPSTAKVIAALDRTKEPGSLGEPLYMDIVTTINECFADEVAPFANMPKIIGGRYGLSSKEFTPAMVKGIFDEMSKPKPKNHFTIGIIDDVTNTSLDYDPDFDIESDDVVRAVFWGLGADGTVGANKNSIKIIGEGTSDYAQGYFVYDSKKSGARTVSYLRFGPKPIHSTYLVRRANFIAVHQFGFLEKYNVLETAIEGTTFLLNSPYGPDDIWDNLSRQVQTQIVEKKLKFYIIDAYAVAKQTGMGVRINTIMQTCFFAISGVLPRDEAIAKIKEAIKKTYGKRGEAVVAKNYAAVDASIENMHELKVPDKVTSTVDMRPVVPAEAPEFVHNVIAKIMAGDGDMLPVSAMPDNGAYPIGTTQWEKRDIAIEIPIWEEDICIQCGKCVFVCPHAVIRAKLVDDDLLANAPAGFKSVKAKWKEFKDKNYTLQISAADCTGCSLCMEICPAKDKSQVGRKSLNMHPKTVIPADDHKNWDYFLTLPEISHDTGLNFGTVKNAQLLQPLFEFSGACMGCGETPYIKLVTQLFGDRTIIANATGCSSIYGGNLPTAPWAYNPDGRGPAWSNSLFEDNAEFGMGMRLTIDKQTEYARELVDRMRLTVGAELAEALLTADQSTQLGIAAQRRRVIELKNKLFSLSDPVSKDLLTLADMLVNKSVWIIGGDGWAYDIGYGGLDHVMASEHNVNVLVLDTEVYSNTGGQASKATPMGAVAKFAAGGKPTFKKDLGLITMSYGNVYVAQIAMGASDTQTIKAIQEAEAHDGPSLIIAYSHCIAHGIDITKGLHQQKLAVDSGYWLLYRYNPALQAEGKNPLQLDSKAPKLALKDYMYTENRFRMLNKSNPDAASNFLNKAQELVNKRFHDYERLAGKKKVTN